MTPMSYFQTMLSEYYFFVRLSLVKYLSLHNTLKYRISNIISHDVSQVLEFFDLNVINELNFFVSSSKNFNVCNLGFSGYLHHSSIHSHFQIILVSLRWRYSKSKSHFLEQHSEHIVFYTSNSCFKRGCSSWRLCTFY